MFYFKVFISWKRGPALVKHLFDYQFYLLVFAFDKKLQDKSLKYQPKQHVHDLSSVQ